MQGHHGYVPTLAHTRSPISYSTHNEGTALSTCAQRPSSIFSELSSAVQFCSAVTGKERMIGTATEPANNRYLGCRFIFSKSSDVDVGFHGTDGSLNAQKPLRAKAVRYTARMQRSLTWGCVG